MKYARWIAVIVALSLILSAIFFWDQQQQLPQTVSGMGEHSLPVCVIDAGHGGIDGGTSGADGTVEKHINLAIAQKLESVLTAFGFQVIMTRTQDDLISDPDLPTIRERKKQDIYKRLEMVESTNNSVLISIHQNFFESSRYSGTQVFYSPNHAESKMLAEQMQKTVAQLLQPENTRVCKPVGSEIYLLYHAKKPAIMVECGFLSNAKELSLLKNEAYQTQMAFCIAIGLLQYYQTEDISVG